MLKRKIADWIYRFWYKNHTHLWEYVEQNYDQANAKVRCRLMWKNNNKGRIIKTKINKMNKELKLTSVEKWVMKYMNYSLEDIKLNRIKTK